MAPLFVQCRRKLWVWNEWSRVIDWQNRIACAGNLLICWRKWSDEADAETKLDSMRWFSHRRRTGGADDTTTYLPTDVVEWPTATPATPTSVCFFLRSDSSNRHILECGYPGVGPVAPKFELGRDYCTLHLTAKFYRPTFNRLEVIVFTNKQTPLKTSTSLRYATPVGIETQASSSALVGSASALRRDWIAELEFYACSNLLCKINVSYGRPDYLAYFVYFVVICDSTV